MVDHLERPATDEQLWLLNANAPERAKSTAPDPELYRHALEMIERGYTVVRGAIPDELCDRAVESFHQWCADNSEHADSVRDEYGHFPRLHNFHRASRDAEKLFSLNTRALAVQDFCFGYPTVADSSLFFERGSSQKTHRDLPYFCTVPLNFYFGMWVALEEVDQDNGPLRVRPGGHRIAIDQHRITRQHHPPGEPIENVCPHLWDPYQEELSQACDAAGVPTETLLVEKGDTVIWHPLLPHGGAPLRDRKRSRFSMVFHTVPEGVAIYRGGIFFDESAHPPQAPPYGYREADGRLLADAGRAMFSPGSKNQY